MVHEVQFLANNGVWMHEVPLHHPEQTETVSDGALLPLVQWYGDTVSRDAPHDEINNAWSPPTSSSVIALGTGERIPHMHDHNGEEESKSPGHTWKHSIWMP
jgi:hypothetical protein